MISRIGVVLFIILSIVGCKSKINMATGESSSTTETSSEDLGVLIVAYDDNFNPKMCWKCTKERWLYFRDNGELSWSQKNNNDISIKGKNIGLVEVRNNELPWEMAAQLLGVNLIFCVNGKYLEK